MKCDVCLTELVNEGNDKLWCPKCGANYTYHG